MNKIAITIGLATAALLATHAFAQSGEAGAAGSKPPVKATQEEKAAAKKMRKEAGIEATKEVMKGDSSAQVKVAKDERKAAAVKRKAAATEANKKGQIQTGETTK